MQLIKSLTQNFFSGKCIKKSFLCGSCAKKQRWGWFISKVPSSFSVRLFNGIFLCKYNDHPTFRDACFLYLECLCIELCLTECYFLMVKLETPCSAGLESSDIRQPSWTLLCNVGIWKRFMWQKGFIVWVG